jgi:Protein of unknown function (DUF1573)
MKIKHLTILLVLFASIINAQLVGPKIHSLETEHNFGQIVEGSIVEYDFEVVNAGDHELSIFKVSSTCGCTVVKPKKDKLQPGETTKIKVTFNSTSRKGKQKKLINIFTNDSKNKRYRLSIIADVVSKEDLNNSEKPVAKISLDNNQHNFGTVKEGSVLSWDLNIKSIGEDTLIITDVKTSCGCTAVLVSNDKLKPGESGSVRIELDTKGMKGKKSRTIAINSNDPLNKRMIVTLFVDVEK